MVVYSMKNLIGKCQFVVAHIPAGFTLVVATYLNYFIIPKDIAELSILCKLSYQNNCEFTICI